jgi:hypothetical protein
MPFGYISEEHTIIRLMPTESMSSAEKQAGK